MTTKNLTPRRARRVLEVTQRFLQTPYQQRIQVVRSLALAGLPRRPTDQKSLDRTLRFGSEAWVRVRYSTASKTEPLPFGQDRVILTGVLHLALEQDDPIVTFDRAADLLDLFDMHRGGSAYRRLKERLGRLKGLNVDILWGKKLDDLTAENEGTGMRLIVDWRLPSRKTLPAPGSDQLVMFPGAEKEPYGVRLSQDFWNYIHREGHEPILRLPLELLKEYTDRPLAWDYALFLLARCGAARTASKVPHEALLGLFSDGDRPDRAVIQDLKRYHQELRLLAPDLITARWIEDGVMPSTGGRPPKRWALLVEPSAALTGRKGH